MQKFRDYGWHIIFWVCIFLYKWLPNASLNDDKFLGYFYFAAANIPIMIWATYFNIYFTFQRYLLKGRRFEAFGCLMFSLIGFGLLSRVVNYWYIYPHIYPVACKAPFWHFPKLIMHTIEIHLIVAVPVMIELMKRWLEQRREAEMLMREKVAAELQLLKSQVQPHFIFNTLNNIYMLSLKGSPSASEMIFGLSSLLNYMLYESKNDLVDIEKEIDYLKNYINLEKIRYGERLDAQLVVSNNVKGIKVPPLLVLPLIENAFKHGVSNEMEAGWIDINFSRMRNQLIIKVENSICEYKKINEDFKNGLGLENLRRRLEIMMPERYELKILEEDGNFLATLKLTFEDNSPATTPPLSMQTEKTGFQGDTKKIPALKFKK